ncbi:DMT family transporter [archaeon]|nr:DMT family transporter [archaeon]
MESWLFFSLLAPAILSVVNIVDKFIMSKKIKNVFPYYVLLGIIYFVISIIILFFVGLPKFNASLSLFLLTGALLSYCLGIYFRVLQIDEVSRVMSLTQVTPLVVTVLAFLFLGEKFSLLKYLGIFATVLGAVIISIEINTRTIRRAAKYMISYVVIIAVLNIIYKHSLSELSFWQVYSLTLFFAGLFLFSFGILKKGFSEMLKLGKIVKYTVTNEILTVMGWLVYLKAISLGPVTLVSSLAVIQPIFVLIYATVLSVFWPRLIKEILNKKEITKKIAGVLLITLGAIFLTY